MHGLIASVQYTIMLSVVAGDAQFAVQWSQHNNNQTAYGLSCAAYKLNLRILRFSAEHDQLGPLNTQQQSVLKTDKYTCTFGIQLNR
jgi:hypothetical protein